MQKVERQARRKSRYDRLPRERPHIAQHVITVEKHPVDEPRQNAPARAAKRAPEQTAPPKQTAHIAHEAPGVHLPGRPRALAKEEVGHECGHGAHHKACPRAQHGPRKRGNGPHRLDVGDGGEQHAPRGGHGGEHCRGHELP